MEIFPAWKNLSVWNYWDLVIDRDKEMAVLEWRPWLLKKGDQITKGVRKILYINIEFHTGLWHEIGKHASEPRTKYKRGVA